MLLSQQVSTVNLKSAKQLWSFFPQKMPILRYLTKASKIMGSPKAKKKFLTFTCFHSTISKESKLIMFQVKIIHNILPTQSSLFQARITDNEVCYLSNLENQSLILDTCWHVITCTVSSSFWTCLISNWWQSKVTLSKSTGTHYLSQQLCQQLCC